MGEKSSVYPAVKAPQADIALRSRKRRIFFIGGLVGFVLLVLLICLFTPA